MLWIVDGYNVIRNNPDLLAAEREGLQAGREALFSLVAALLAERTRDRALVVFDGPARSPRPEGAPSGPPVGRMTVLFSAGRAADDLILEHLAADPNPRQAAVVSRDREITRAARRKRCPVLDPEEFVSRIRAGEQRRRLAASEAVSPESRGKIEEELRRRWLPEKGRG